MLLFIPFVLLLIIGSFLHNSIISNALDEKLKKLHASGIFIEMQHEEDNVFSNKKDFIIRLDKVELVAELLFGLRNNDPLVVQLSKLQGLKLNVKLSHNKFIFSNELVMYLSMHTLPEYFLNQSQLFTELVDYSHSHPDLIQTKLNVWDNSFSFHIPTLHHLFLAEHNMSFNVNLENFLLYGYIKNHSDFDIYNDCQSLHVAMLEKNTTKVELDLNQSSINLNHVDKTLDSSIFFKDLVLKFALHEPLTLAMHNLNANQNFAQEDESYFKSLLQIEQLKLSSTKDIFSLDNINYDLALKHLDYTTIAHIRELIHTSNTNTVAFIFDDLSKDIQTLIKHQAEIKVRQLSFSDIAFEDKHYQDAKLSLHAISQPENTLQPIDFDLKIHLSQALYQAFLNNVANASLTENFIKDSNSSVDFHLELTEKGFLLNKKDIFPKPSKTDTNSTNSVIQL